MSLIKWEPLNEFDRFFDERFLQSFPKIGWDLATDVYEEKGTIVVKMSVPGVKLSDVDVSIKDGILTVSGNREDEHEVKNKDYYSKEIRRGSFSRSISLPKNVEAEKAKAQFHDGFLMVTLPKTPDSEDKSIKVTIEKVD